MRSPLGGLRRWLTAPDQPLAAVEVRAGSVGCLRLVREAGQLRLGTAAVVDLPPGVVVASPVEANVRDAEIFGRALRSAVEQAGLAAGASVALVVPDAAARAVLLTGELEGGGTSLDDLVRFRLRKSVPFEIREASIAAVRLPAVGGAPAAVLAAAMARAVLESYEAPLESQGLRAGLVELSGLALARYAAADPGDRLVVNLEPDYLTLVLSRDGRPLLLRTLSEGAAGGLDGVVREVRQTLLYHRDRLGGGELAAAALRPSADDDAVASGVAEALGCEPSSVEPWRALGAGVPGGRGSELCGAACSLLAGERAA